VAPSKQLERLRVSTVVRDTLRTPLATIDGEPAGIYTRVVIAGPRFRQLLERILWICFMYRLYASWQSGSSSPF